MTKTSPCPELLFHWEFCFGDMTWGIMGLTRFILIQNKGVKWQGVLPFNRCEISVAKPFLLDEGNNDYQGSSSQRIGFGIDIPWGVFFSGLNIEAKLF